MEVLQEEELSTMRNRQKELQLEEAQEEKKIKQMYEKEDALEKENVQTKIFIDEKAIKLSKRKTKESSYPSKTFLQSFSQTVSTRHQGQYCPIC